MKTWIISIFLLGCSTGAPVPTAQNTDTEAIPDKVQASAPATKDTTPKTPVNKDAANGNVATGPGDVENGAKVYSTYCKACHQVDGKAMGGMLGADFTDPERMKESDSKLLNSIKNGFKGKRGQMPPWGQALSDQEMVDVLAYIRATFQP
jgi:mono/diheme cytochrome c family protein